MEVPSSKRMLACIKLTKRNKQNLHRSGGATEHQPLPLPPTVLLEHLVGIGEGLCYSSHVGILTRATDWNKSLL